jgi:hypothetical protein
MQIRIFIYVLALLILPAFIGSSSALADPGHGHKHKHDDDNDSSININISLSDQEIIRSYIKSGYHPHCPPGLAKKHNGCLPPGIAKKYHMGERLDAEYTPLPEGILVKLHPMAGYQYVQVDRDVLLISEASKKVIDAVTLLSAVK